MVNHRAFIRWLVAVGLAAAAAPAEAWAQPATNPPPPDTPVSDTGGEKPSEAAAGEAPAAVGAEPASGAEMPAEVDPLGMDEELDSDPLGFDGVELPSPFETSIYGYVDAQWRELAFTTGLPSEKAEHFPTEFRENKGGAWLNANLMFQGRVFDKYHWFVNLGAFKAADIVKGDSSLDVRNGWVEVPLFQQYLLLRAGKTYRRFGLYNEILDAAPTFPGVEPPAYLVTGQLLLPRTTNIMVHGTWLAGQNRLQYTFHTGTDERDGSYLPIGGDLRYHIAGDTLTIGASGYWTVGSAEPSRAVGEGSPIGGVINWMAEDTYTVVGGYAQLLKGPLLVQGAYFRADHDAERDPGEVLKLAGGELNPRQRERLFNGVDNPTVDDVNIEAEYAVQTAYTRIAYAFRFGDLSTFTPYVHLGWYSHPEAVEGLRRGGNEAGLSDDGQFFRTVVGFVYRPVPAVAFKLELNPHYQQVGGQTAIFAPVQTSISYYWNLGQ